mgnify:CR=1 FL=1
MLKQMCTAALSSVLCLVPVLVLGLVGTASAAGSDILPELSAPVMIRSDEDVQDLEQGAERAYHEGRFQDCIRLYSVGISRYPANASLYLGRGMAYEMALMEDAAARDYRKAISVAAGNYRAIENLAGILERRGNAAQEVINLYKRALELDPRPEWRENLAVWIRMLESSQRPATESAVAAWHTGNALALQGRTQDALAWYSRAIELNSLFFQAYHSRALVRLRTGDREGAVQDLDMAIAVSPGLRGALVLRALICEESGDRTAALEDLRRAVTADPRDPRAHFHLGRMLQEDGLQQEARNSFQKALELDPKADFRALISQRASALSRSEALRSGNEVVKNRIRRMLQRLW